MEVALETIGRAWLEAVRLIIDQGEEVIHEGKPVKQIDNLVLKIEKPLEINQEAITKNMAYLNAYDFIYNINPDPNHKFPEYDRIFYYNGLNQFDAAITKLKMKPDTRSATISLIEPPTDFKGNFPCLCIMDYKIHNNKLGATILYRSHDYGTKALSNLAFQSELMNVVCHETKTEPGNLICHSISAHLNYFE